MRAMHVVALALLYTGCHQCEIEVVAGDTTTPGNRNVIHANDRLALRACIADRELTCGGHWLVNGIEGGSPTFGTIDNCGNYAAPASFPDTLAAIEIVADFPGLETCPNCCTSAVHSFTPGPDGMLVQ
jgi:hypothetical protein